MPHFITGDSYQTPPDTPRRLLDRLGGNGRFFLHLSYIGILTHARLRVARGGYGSADFAHTSRRIFRLVERSGGRFHVSGLDHLRAAAGPVVIVGNHMSALENNALPALVGPIKPITFVIKASLLKYPIFGPVIGSQQPIAVARSNPRADFQAVMAQGVELLQAGRSIVLYPGGTRRTTFDPAALNTLGVKLARKAGVSIIPMAVKTDFWRNGRMVRDLGPVDRRQSIHMAFGKAVSVTGGGRAAHQQVLDFISGKLSGWGVTVEA